MIVGTRCSAYANPDGNCKIPRRQLKRLRRIKKGGSDGYLEFIAPPTLVI